MIKLSVISGKKMIKILIKSGFREMRRRGSHHFFFNEETKKTATVPVHNNEDLSTGLIKEILKDVDLSVEEYEKLRQEV